MRRIRKKRPGRRRKLKGNDLDRGFDLRRFLLLSVRRLWMLLVGAVIGAVLFGGYRFLKEKVFAPAQIYRADTEFYINFTKGQEEDTQAYFNDYTWNDVIDTDVIAGSAAAIVEGADKEYIAAATFVPTLSDIRMFHVQVDDTDPAMANRIMNALELSIMVFPNYVDGMDSITVLDREPAKAVVEMSTIFRWAAAGAIIGILAAILVLSYVYVMDDTIRIAEDIKTAGGNCLGILFKGKQSEREEESLKEALDREFGKTEEIRMIDPAGTAVPAEAAARIKEMLGGDKKYNTGNKEAKILCCVAAGSMSIAELKRFVQDKDTAVVFCEADHKLHGLYYFYANRKEASNLPGEIGAASKEDEKK